MNKISNKMLVVGMVLIIFGGFLSGCDNSSKKNPVDKQTVEKITQEEAEAIALKEAGEGELTHIALNVTDNSEIFTFTIRSDTKEYEVSIDVNGGKIIRYSESDLSNNYIDSNNIISVEEAKEIALEESSGGNILECYLVTEDSSLVYEIEIVNDDYEYEIEVDAVTGDILKSEQEKIR